MSRKLKASGITKARNSLRPLFNDRKAISFWKQIQAVRQETSFADLPALCSFAESNSAFPFPGIGNTFPEYARLIPNPKFGLLRPLELRRELALQVARINHHAIRVRDALNSISQQHRKVAALDMETYGVYYAASESDRDIRHYFSVKAVVDFADETKDDKLHEYGCLVSARAAIGVIGSLVAG
jgi:hypothetical protein